MKKTVFGEPSPVKLAPKFQPKLRLRLTDERTKRMSEAVLSVPADGFLSDDEERGFFLQVRKMLEVHGLLAAGDAQAEEPAAEE